MRRDWVREGEALYVAHLAKFGRAAEARWAEIGDDCRARWIRKARARFYTKPRVSKMMKVLREVGFFA